MRPELNPALRRLWRDPATVQFGLDAERAVVLEGVDDVTAALLGTLDGTRDRAAVILGAAVGPERAAELLDALVRAGVVDDAGGDRSALRDLPVAERDRLAPDVASLALAHRSRALAEEAVRRRRESTVRVRGAGRLGGPLAALLAAAGVGAVSITDAGRVRPEDLAPGGLTADQLGDDRAAAAACSVRVAAPSVRTPLGGRADVEVIATPGVRARTAARRLSRAGTPHLVVDVQEAWGVVGPFVLPGSTACLECLDQHRADRDPGWPVLLAQLDERPHAQVGRDVVLTAAVAARAATVVLAHLDGGTPDCTDATWELRTGSTSWRRRGWSAHPGCGCCTQP